MLRQDLGVTSLTARLLVNRGLTTSEEAYRFLHPDYSHLPDPLLLPDAEPAVERLKQALQKREKIFVHGDYDGDGITSAALWFRLLETLGADVQVHVPHRRRDGYDIRSDFVQKAKAEGIGLIVTTDCGIQRCDEVEEAREAGIDVVITDHHEPGPALPRAAAVVNPHRKDSIYPFPSLAGVGVAFRLGEALVRGLGQSVSGYRRAYSDLAAIGTVTDIMPLLGDNRVIVREGLQTLAATKKPGLQALFRTAGIAGKPLTAESIAFQLGPRLNAIGRVDDARLALDLLLTRDTGKAQELAERLECANNERKVEQSRIYEEAKALASRLDPSETYCIVLHEENWHGGVIGIVASKIVEWSGRPTVLIALNTETGEGRGSARSILPFDMLEAITACGTHLAEFGGHSHAAGMSIPRENCAAFAEAMNRYAQAHLTEEDLVPVLAPEVEIETTQVTLRLLEELAMFEPWGNANREPLFISRNAQVKETKRMGAQQQHLKLLTEWDGIRAPDCVFWGAGDLAEHLHPGDHYDLCYRPQTNVWNGRTSVQFRLEDLRPSDTEEW